MHERPHTPIYALPIWLDLPCRTNSDYGEEFVFSESGEPLDLTGMTFAMDVKPSPDSTTALHSFVMAASEAGEGFFLTDPTGGAVQLRMTWETLQTMFNAVYPNNIKCHDMRLSYDIVVTYPDGDRSAWIAGNLTLGKGVTYG